jgi:hypothetical protein
MRASRGGGGTSGGTGPRPYTHAVALEIVVLIIACGAIAAGYGYVRLGRQMRSYPTVEGQVTGRDVAVIPGAAGGEGRWGSGGRYSPKVTYSYVVDGVTYTSYRWSYAGDGRKRSIAEAQLAAVPATVTVFYDPNDPGQAYLHTHPPRIGYALLVGGAVGVVAALAALLG